jgi:hypothetical protein
MIMKRLIELYVGYPNHTWDTTYQYVDADLPEDEAVEQAINHLSEQLTKNKIATAFIGLYWYDPEPFEED